jgi:transglutaminase-like putative cysteine protease
MFSDYSNPIGVINVPPTRTIDIGTEESANYATIREMIDIIKKSSNHPYVRQWAENLLQNIPARDQKSEAEAIYYFCRDNIRYTPDPLDLEYLITPPLLLSKIEQGIIPMGDCDDYSVLASSLLRSIGIPCRLKITSYSSDGDWGHVYCQAFIGKLNDGTGLGSNGQWRTIDPIRNNENFGWEAPNPTRQKIFNIE